jgi:hypothetical protein
VIERQLDQTCLKFLDKYLDSLEKLELLRHMRAAGQAIARSDLEAVFSWGDDMILTITRELLHDGLLEEPPDGPDQLRLGPLALTSTFGTIMSSYELDRVVVISALSSIAMGRIRNMAARTFADAFVLKKRREDDDG